MFNQIFKPVDEIEVPVSIPVLGREEVTVKMRFKVMAVSEFHKIDKNEDGSIKGEDQLVEVLQAFLLDWDAEKMGVEYSSEALEQLLDINPATKNAILNKYIDIMANGKVGNSKKRR